MPEHEEFKKGLGAKDCGLPTRAVGLGGRSLAMLSPDSTLPAPTCRLYMRLPTPVSRPKLSVV